MLLMQLSSDPTCNPVKPTSRSLISATVWDALRLYWVLGSFVILMNLVLFENESFFFNKVIIESFAAMLYNNGQCHRKFGTTPFLFAMMLQALGCSSSVFTAIDFEDDTLGTCPEYWICDDVSITYIFGKNRWKITPDGEKLFNIGKDSQIGKAVSYTFVLPDEIDHIQYLHAGGADSGSGFWVKRLRDRASLCHSMDGTNTDTLFEVSCDGLAAYAGETVYFQAEDNQDSDWGKVMIDYIRLQDVNNNNLPFCFETSPITVGPSSMPTVKPSVGPSSMPTVKPDGCASSLLSAIDFEDGIAGTCPDYWTCDDVSVTRLFNDLSSVWTTYWTTYTTPNGVFMFIIGGNNHIGKAVSDILVLPDKIDHVQYLHGGGANTGSGLWVKRASDRTTLCHSTESQDTNTLFETSCDGLGEYAGESVVLQAEDNQVSDWGKLMIDYIRFQDVNNNDLPFCFGTFGTTVLPTTAPTISPTLSPTTDIPSTAPSLVPSQSPTVMPTFPAELAKSDGTLTSVAETEIVIILAVLILIIVIVVVGCSLKSSRLKKEKSELEMKIAEMVNYNRNRSPEHAEIAIEGDHEGILRPTGM